MFGPNMKKKMLNRTAWSYKLVVILLSQSNNVKNGKEKVVSFS